MKPGTYNMTIYQGSDWEFWVPGYRDTVGQIVDLTGYTAKMQIRDRKGGELLVELTTENGRIVLGGAAGTILLTLDHATTAAMRRGGVYDLELTSSAGKRGRLLQGSVALSEEVTRDA